MEILNTSLKYFFPAVIPFKTNRANIFTEISSHDNILLGFGGKVIAANNSTPIIHFLPSCWPNETDAGYSASCQFVALPTAKCYSVWLAWRPGCSNAITIYQLRQSLLKDDEECVVWSRRFSTELCETQSQNVNSNQVRSWHLASRKLFLASIPVIKNYTNVKKNSCLKGTFTH